MLYVIREHHRTVGQGELVDKRTPTPPPPPSPSVFLLRMNGPEKVEAQQHDKEKCTYCLVYTPPTVWTPSNSSTSAFRRRRTVEKSFCLLSLSSVCHALLSDPTHSSWHCSAHYSIHQRTVCKLFICLPLRFG